MKFQKLTKHIKKIKQKFLILIFFFLTSCKPEKNYYDSIAITLSLNSDFQQLSITNMNLIITCENFTNKQSINNISEKTIFIPKNNNCTIEIESFIKNDIKYTAAENNQNLKITLPKNIDNTEILYKSSVENNEIQVSGNTQLINNILNLNFTFTEIPKNKKNISIKIKKIDKKHTQITITAKKDINLDTINFLSKNGTKKTKAQISNLTMFGSYIQTHFEKKPKCYFKNSHLSQHSLPLPNNHKYTDTQINRMLEKTKRFETSSLSPKTSCVIVLKHSENENDTIIETSLTDKKHNTLEFHKFSLN